MTGELHALILTVAITAVAAASSHPTTSQFLDRMATRKHQNGKLEQEPKTRRTIPMPGAANQTTPTTSPTTTRMTTKILKIVVAVADVAVAEVAVVVAEVETATEVGIATTMTTTKAVTTSTPVMLPKMVKQKNHR